MKNYLSLIIILISIATVISGLAQIVAPGFVLGVIGAEISPASTHFFAIIGMFMALFGGMMLQAIYSVESNKAAVLWASFQKLGAAVAVGIGIVNGIFNTTAAAVAVFDLISGLLFIYYYTTIKTS